MRKGIVLVMSGPSGAGKSTLTQRLLADVPSATFSISCTSRQPRAGEVDGRDYYFISGDEFERRRKAGEFAEWATVHNNLYGTPVEPLNKLLNSGKDVILDIDVQGACQFKMSMPDSSFVFVLPPSLKILRQRLLARGLDDAAIIEARLKKAREEINQAGWFDGIIVNDNLEKAYRELQSFYIAATLKPQCIQPLLSAFMHSDFTDA